MGDLSEELTGLNRLIHEPARLTLMTALSSCRRADFMFLQRLTGLTKGNLGSHLGKLENAGLVRLEKRFVNRKPNTRVGLTAAGRRAIADHWKRLEELRQRSQDWEMEELARNSSELRRRRKIPLSFTPKEETE